MTLSHTRWAGHVVYIRGRQDVTKNFGVEVFRKAITKKTKNLMVGQHDGIGEMCCVN